MINNFYEETMETLFQILKASMERPQPYGWFHLMCTAIMILVTVLLCIFFKDCDYKTYRRIALIIWITVVVCEIYKQFIFTFDYTDGQIVGKYQWYIFPFQFCSTIFYVLPFIAFMKRNKFTGFLTAFSSIFMLIAGVLVYAIPTDIYIDTIGINIQTMIHHGSQIIFGVFTIVYFRKDYHIGTFIRSITVFAGFVATAILLNELMFDVANNSGEVFNMFFISRHYTTTLPVANLVDGKVPHPVFVMLYFLGFSLLAFITYAITKVILLACAKLSPKKHATSKI